ncbi:MAG: trehalose-phosphatase [Acidobacteriota bacterium]|nr:trehalose-phosphatase [Acidobacteriota bacterium]
MTCLGLPSALASWSRLERRLRGKRLALLLDYDGTLAPIAPRPELATLPEPTRRLLDRLARTTPTAILSGRDREDVAALVGLNGIVYAGSHGFDIAGPSRSPGGPALHHEVGADIPAQIPRVAAQLRRDLGDIPGVLIEPKRFAVAVHYRLAPEESLPRIERAVGDAATACPALKKTLGKKVFELRPALDWDKGKALLWILHALDLDAPDVVPVYLGDDVTDEDAFRAVAERGIGILVASAPRPTAATCLLRDPAEVRELLERLATLPAP